MLENKQVIISFMVSIVLSSLIGIDRESTKKPVGFRANVLV